jgi:hypothetical protein
MGDWYPMTLPSGGSVSTRAGGRDCCKEVEVGAAGVGVASPGRPPQAVRINADSRIEFRMRALVRSAVEVTRRFAMVPRSGSLFLIHYTLERIKKDMTRIMSFQFYCAPISFKMLLSCSWKLLNG